MITQIIIPVPNFENKYTGLTEDFTFSGYFPSKKDVTNHIKSVIKKYPVDQYRKALRTIKSAKPKEWPNLNKLVVSCPGSVEFEKDITIMQMIDSPFDKNIGVTIIWKILNPCKLKRN